MVVHLFSTFAFSAGIAMASDDGREDHFFDKAKQFRICLTCEGNPVKHKSHFSGRTQEQKKHSHKAQVMSDVERHVWAKEQVQLEQGGSEARRAHVRHQINEAFKQRVADVASAASAGNEDAAANPATSDGNEDAPANAVVVAGSPEGNADAPVDAAVVAAPWRIDFGKHSRKKNGGPRTVEEVMRIDSDYFANLASQTEKGKEPFGTNLVLKAELQKAGVWDKVLRRGKELLSERAQRCADKANRGETSSMHPQVAALNKIEILRGDMDLHGVAELPANDSAAPTPSQNIKKRARSDRASRATRFLKNCLLCGQHGHVWSTCPTRSDMQLLQMEEDRLAKLDNLSALECRRRKLIAHLKYTCLDTRTKAYEARCSQRSRAPVARSFRELDRALPLE